jgi:hypothetical protein
LDLGGTVKSFRAAYIPTKYSGPLKEFDGADTNNARTVLIVAILAPDIAIFIDSDNTLKSDTIGHFSDCQSSEWMER